MMLAPVHEPCVDAQRDVVQEQAVVRASDVDADLSPVDECVERPDRVVPVEPDVTREVVARPERDAGEREITLERRLRDDGERPVAAGHRERVGLVRRGRARRGRPPHAGRGSRCPARAAAASSSSEPPLPELGLTIRNASIRANVAGSPRSSEDGPNGSCGRPMPGRSSAMERGILHQIEDDLSETWVEEWAEQGVRGLEELPREAPRLPLVPRRRRSTLGLETGFVPARAGNSAWRGGVQAELSGQGPPRPSAPSAVHGCDGRRSTPSRRSRRC